MPSLIKDKLDLSNKNWLDILVDYRLFLTTIVVIVSVALAVFVSGLTTDPDPEIRCGYPPAQRTCSIKNFIDIFGMMNFPCGC